MAEGGIPGPRVSAFIGAMRSRMAGATSTSGSAACVMSLQNERSRPAQSMIRISPIYTDQVCLLVQRYEGDTRRSYGVQKPKGNLYQNWSSHLNKVSAFLLLGAFYNQLPLPQSETRKVKVCLTFSKSGNVQILKQKYMLLAENILLVQ